MKVLIIFVPLVASCLAGEVSYSPATANQKGLLVLPKPAPVPSASNYQNQEQYVIKNNYKQEAQTPAILSPEFAERRGVYFVEVPQERIQALQGYRQQQTSQYNSFPASAAAQEENFVKYLPLEDSTAQLQTAPTDYRQSPADVPVVRYLPVPLTEQTLQYRRQEEAPAGGYQAVVQYSEVQPIQGPVYSYSPEGLTRVLRYAPVY